MLPIIENVPIEIVKKIVANVRFGVPRAQSGFDKMSRDNAG